MKLLNNDSTITFKLLGGELYDVQGGIVESVQMLPDNINYHNFDKFSLVGKGAERKVIVRKLTMPLTNPVFIFESKDFALVGQARHGSHTEIQINGIEISSHNALFQIRTMGATVSDTVKLAPFYKGTRKPFEENNLYWAVATAIAEYGVELKDSTDNARLVRNNSLSAMAGKYPTQGGVSMMGVDFSSINWDEIKSYERFGNFTDAKPQGNSYLLLDGRRIALPDNVKHTGKFEDLFVFEHKNGKVKEGSVLCLLNSKEHDPNTLALVENQIKAAEALAASLRIFAEVLRAEGQVITPAPLNKNKKRR